MPRKIDTQNTTKEAHSANARASTTDKNSRDKQAHTSVAVEPTTSTTKSISQMHLSKSQYLRGVQCHKRLWLYKYKPQAQDTPTQSQLARFQAGNEVGELALKLFECKEKIAFSEGNFKNKPNTNPKNTQTQSAQTSNTLNPQYKLILQRLKEYSKVVVKGKDNEPSTIGEIRLLNDRGETLFKCYSCENGGPSTDTPKQDKRIVARDNYKLNWSSSGVNGGCARNYTQWQVKNNQCPIKVKDGTSGANIVIWLTCPTLSSFASRRIHIHSGNCPQHTEGCLLFGYTDNKDGTIGNSAKCINDFYELVLKLGVENITLEIKEIDASDLAKS